MVVRMDPTAPPSVDPELQRQAVQAHLDPNIFGTATPNASSSTPGLGGGGMGTAAIQQGMVRSGAQEFGARTPPGYKPPAATWQVYSNPQDFYSWSDSELQQFRKKAIEAGLVPDNPSLTQLYQAWLDLIQQSSSYKQAGKNLSPWDVLGSQVSMADPQQAGFTGKKTRVDTTIQKVDAQAAKAAVRENVKSLIGKNPTTSQLSRLTGVFRNYFLAHPEQVRVTTQYVGGQPTATNTETISPGATAEGAQEEIRRRVEATDDYGVYQATSFYGNQLFEMLGAL